MIVLAHFRGVTHCLSSSSSSATAASWISSSSAWRAPLMSGVVVRSCSIVRNPRWTRGCNPSLHPQQRPRRPARAVFSSSSSSLRRQRGNYNHNNNNRNRIPPYVWMVGVASTGWVVWMVGRGLDSVPWTGRRRWIITSP